MIIMKNSANALCEADPDFERLKQAHDQNSRSFGGSELARDMGLF